MNFMTMVTTTIFIRYRILFFVCRFQLGGHSEAETISGTTLMLSHSNS